MSSSFLRNPFRSPAPPESSPPPLSPSSHSTDSPLDAGAEQPFTLEQKLAMLEELKHEIEIVDRHCKKVPGKDGTAEAAQANESHKRQHTIDESTSATIDRLATKLNNVDSEKGEKDVQKGKGEEKMTMNHSPLSGYVGHRFDRDTYNEDSDSEVEYEELVNFRKKTTMAAGKGQELPASTAEPISAAQEVHHPSRTHVYNDDTTPKPDVIPSPAAMLPDQAPSASSEFIILTPSETSGSRGSPSPSMTATSSSVHTGPATSDKPVNTLCSRLMTKNTEYNKSPANATTSSNTFNTANTASTVSKRSSNLTGAEKKDVVELFRFCGTCLLAWELGNDIFFRTQRDLLEHMVGWFLMLFIVTMCKFVADSPRGASPQEKQTLAKRQASALFKLVVGFGLLTVMV